MGSSAAAGPGTVSILNVAGGDIRLRFDKDNPAESIRAARVIKDMLRRGYALLVEVERDGEKRFERALDFLADTNEYIIADFAPEESATYDHIAAPDIKERAAVEPPAEAGDEPGGAEESDDSPRRGRGRPRGSGRTAVAAEGVRAVAVGRSAGG